MSETVNAILYDEGHVAVLMPDERPIKHVALESPSKTGMQGDLSWRYYIPESYAAILANENAKLRELLQRLLAEYRYMIVRPRKVYMQHERRMRVIEEEMRELGVEVPD